MEFDCMNEVLPVGSIVKIRFNDAKIMITGYTPKNSETGKMYDYMGMIYPYGFDKYDNVLSFNRDVIKKVLFVGYKTKGLKEVEKVILSTMNEK